VATSPRGGGVSTNAGLVPVETWRDDTDVIIQALSTPVRDVFSDLQCRVPREVKIDKRTEPLQV